MPTFHIDPCPKPRMTRSDAWNERDCVLKYHAFCDELRLLSHNMKLPEKVEIFFRIKMPKSWSNKKRNEMLGKPHQQKPDIDNLIKAVLDCLCKDDSYIWNVTALKQWDINGSITIIER